MWRRKKNPAFSSLAFVDILTSLAPTTVDLFAGPVARKMCWRCTLVTCPTDLLPLTNTLLGSTTSGQRLHRVPLIMWNQWRPIDGQTLRRRWNMPLTFSASCWASSLSSCNLFCLSMETSGFPWAWTSRSLAACSLRLTLWYALLALSSCRGTRRQEELFKSNPTCQGRLNRKDLVVLLSNSVHTSEGHSPQTFLSRLAHGFWARVKPVSMSWDSLKPPNSFLWKVSFCQVLTLSPSSDTRERQMEACREASRSAEDMKHCQAFRRDPYRGPEGTTRSHVSSTKRRSWAVVGEMQRQNLLESTTGVHLLLHSLSCCAYCRSTRALSWKHATMSLQAWKASSVRFTVGW